MNGVCVTSKEFHFNVAGMSKEKLFDKISKYYGILVYFQVAVSALLVVSVLYVEKNQNKILHNISRFLTKRFRQIAFLMKCQQHKCAKFFGECIWN